MGPENYMYLCVVSDICKKKKVIVFSVLYSDVWVSFGPGSKLIISGQILISRFHIKIKSRIASFFVLESISTEL